MSRNRRIVAALLAVVLVAAVAVVVGVAVARHDGRNKQAAPAEPDATVDAKTIAGLQPDQFGISTGIQLVKEEPDRIDADIASIATLGAQWIRTGIRWDIVEKRGPDQDDWTVPDRIVSDAAKHDVRIIFDLTGTPKWARASGAGSVEFPPDLHTYATFAGKLAQRYRGKVAAYELGNEPNHVKSFAHPDPARYEQVLQLTYPAIKAADPKALVLTGGLGGETGKGVLGGDEFLAALYRAGAKPYFDGVSYHPYTYPLMPSDDAGQRSWSRMLNARRTMVANGDSAKKVWITEYGAPTGGPKSVDQVQQAKIMYDAYRLWGSYPWAGPLCWFDYRDKGTDTGDHGNFFGLYTHDDQPKVALRQYQALVRSVR
ncbi:MAG TPA: cellulase family glycosylhydrolase [Acidimicrobiia bacterium]|nr:cellulase family glycosylhydrolase [Acidimicrobiia bacterium]